MEHCINQPTLAQSGLEHITPAPTGLVQPRLLQWLHPEHAPVHQVVREPAAMQGASAGLHPRIVVPRSAAWVEVNGHPGVVASPCSALFLGADDRIDRLPIADEVFVADSLRVPAPLMEAFQRAQSVSQTQPRTQAFAYPWARLGTEQFLALQLCLRKPAAEQASGLHAWMVWVLKHAAHEWRRRPLERGTRAGGHGHSRFALAQSMAAHIEAHWREGSSLQELSERFELSPFHLLRVFRRAMTLTPHQYLLQLRLRRSMHLIENSRQRIIDLALDMGFCSHGHYATAFKAAFGMTPLEFARYRQDQQPVTDGRDAQAGALRR